MLSRTRSSRNRQLRRRLARFRRRTLRTLAAALIAGGTFVAAQSSNAAIIIGGWSPGVGGLMLNASDLETGALIDINSDYSFDFRLDGNFCGYGCSTIELTPLVTMSINNEVFTDGSQIAVTPFSDPDDVLVAGAMGETTVPAPGSAVLWADQYLTDFENPGANAGLIFEVPGGSPYYGYVHMAVVTDFGFDYLYISESGFQPVPEPGTALLGAGGLLGLGWLGRRRARGKRTE